MTQNLKPWIPYAFIAPALIPLTVFVLGPIAYSGYLSLCDWSIVGSPEFVGFGHYSAIASSPKFLTALKNTFLFVFITVPVGLVLALGTALLLNQPVRGRGVFRGIFFFPAIAPTIVLATLWGWLCSEHFGVFNKILIHFGMSPISWLTDPKFAFPTIMAMSIWKGFGYGMVIYLAGLQGIPLTYHEAATMDGANAAQRFRYVTWPLLAPTTLLILVLSVIGSFQVFDQVYVLTGGGPGYSTSVLVHYIYEEAFIRFRMDRASAAAYILFAIIFVFTLIQMRVGDRDYQGERT